MSTVATIQVVCWHLLWDWLEHNLYLTWLIMVREINSKWKLIFHNIVLWIVVNYSYVFSQRGYAPQASSTPYGSWQTVSNGTVCPHTTDGSSSTVLAALRGSLGESRLSELLCLTSAPLSFPRRCAPLRLLKSRSIVKIFSISSSLVLKSVFTFSFYALVGLHFNTNESNDNRSHQYFMFYKQSNVEILYFT